MRFASVRAGFGGTWQEGSATSVLPWLTWGLQRDPRETSCFFRPLQIYTLMKTIVIPYLNCFSPKTQ